MSSSPELDAMKEQMKAVLRRDADGSFDDPKDAETLQVTVRIACEFFMFLQQSNDPPEFEEADYMAGTIRAGLDWFFLMSWKGNCLSELELRTGFGPELPRSFSALKASYESAFRQMLECTRSAKAVRLLLCLAQMMLLFMTAYFPSFSSFSTEASSPK